jgi:hypothetical protein
VEIIIFITMLLFTGFCSVILAIGIVEVYGKWGIKEEEEKNNQTDGQS